MEQIKKNFSGGQRAFEMQMRLLNRLKATYTVESKGSSMEIHYKDRVMSYVTKSHSKDGHVGVGSVCRLVMNDVDRFLASGGDIPEFEYRTTTAINNAALNDFLLKGKRDIYLVDIKACYWTIVKNASVISESTYKKYLDDKFYRLISIGNLKKSTRVSSYLKGVQVGQHIITPNKRAWVWDYVVYKSYEIFDEVNQYIDNRTMMFKTDCFFVVESDVEKVQEKLKELGHESSVEKRLVVGHNRGRIILCTEDGELKHSGFTTSIKAITNSLPHIEMNDSIRDSEAKLKESEEE
jgi:hypothetical protein